MDTDTAEIVRWLRGRALLEEAGLTKNVLAKAADTIERLQKELKESKDWINSAVVACNKRGCSSLERRLRESDELADELLQERDAALAEVERVKGQLQAAETSIQAHRGFVRS